MIHLNIGSNLNSIHGSRFDNISIAIQLLIKSKIKIDKISNFYETPSYPCLLYTSPSPRDSSPSRMPSSA